ncbi:MAG: 30S ribosomal protein S6 [Oscillospiraceae bacterium]|nr:30S ribosomal protein S6 [Oscillospiraceae bacterium]MDE5853365.1 30S ribosomal protein S6 [Oscillospiraceae bacterium]
MAKLKQSYESMIIISTKLGEEEIKSVIEKFKDLISKNSKLESVEEWGKRKLAYPINYETEGYYVLFNFESEPSFPAELDRVYHITDGIMRTLIVAKEV